ncbi:ATP-binding protein [Terrimonas ferruginea]|uniref:DNA polymerase III subunit n=1 Tax=Terrimonas ferruginea TaxID=249 RepID=UPI000405BA11|nr:DNA polymerase III subunit delta' [Terrimonas ferruginea]
MQFKDIIGQETLKKELADLMQENRLAHALLFLGKEGSGALSLAMALAQYVVCEKVNNNNAAPAGPSLFGEEPEPVAKPSIYDSCGECAACVKAAQYAHPDIHYSYPVVTKKPGSPPVSTDYITEWREFMKAYPYGNVYDWLQFIGAENKQGNITAHECNEIIRKLNLKSFESVYKVLVMWLPEYLGNEGNKLLKLIEEPPANTLFILVAENESMILQTILSRCQLVKVPMLETRDIEAALISRNKTDALVARQVAQVSEGNYREALQQVQHADEDWQGLLREWLNAVLKNGPVAQTKWVDEINKLGREKQKQFLRYFNHLLEQAVRLRVLEETAGQLMPEREKDFANRLNKIAGIEQQQAIIEELDKAAYYIERNANGKMLFHALTIKLYHIIRDKVVML